MADAKISGLAAVTTVGATDEYVVAVAGATKKITGANLKLGMGMALISSSALSATAANFDLTSIPQTYSSLRLIVQAATSDASPTILGMTFNNDGSSIYDYQFSGAAAATPAAAEQLAQAKIRIGTLPASTSTSKSGIVDCVIPFYTGTAFHKVAFSAGPWMSGTSTGTLHCDMWSGIWRATTAISRITITPVAGSLIAGSSYALYGM